MTGSEIATLGTDIAQAMCYVLVNREDDVRMGANAMLAVGATDLGNLAWRPSTTPGTA
jgi:hypothetical protein